MDGATWTERTTYDAYGRKFQHFTDLPTYLRNYLHDGKRYSYPATTGEYFQYNARGYLEAVRDADGGTQGREYWTIDAQDARGQVTHTTYRANGAIAVVHDTDPVTGHVNAIQAGGGWIVDQSYQYDALGNMTQRSDTTGTRTLTETFAYDRLQRLTSTTRSGAGITAYQYDASGNVQSKPDTAGQMQTLEYSGVKAAACNAPGEAAPGPHAVSAMGAYTYCYDAAGNQVRTLWGAASLQRELRYNSRNELIRARSLQHGLSVVGFSYGIGGQRLKRLQYQNENGSVTTTTLYVGDMEVDTNASGRVVIRRTIGPMILELQPGLDYHHEAVVRQAYRYRYSDVLGSTVAVTDDFGAGMGAWSGLGYDAWGLRRDVSNGQPLDNTGLQALQQSPPTRLGFTGQPGEDGLALVHLGSRWYDPETGRFLQADSLIGDASNPQALNFYTYVLNNPLAYTDPTGHWGKRQQGYLRSAVAIVIAAYTGYYINTAGLSTSAGFGVAAAGGAASGAVASGNLRGAVNGALSGMLFYGIGSYYQSQNGAWAHVGGDTNAALTTAGWASGSVAYGTAGGIMSELEGDTFGHGFVSAGFTASMSGYIDGRQYMATKMIATTVIGGTASRISGGKFANGAVTAAFAYMVATGMPDMLDFDGSSNNADSARKGYAQSTGSYSLGDVDFQYRLVGPNGYGEAIGSLLDQIHSTNAGASLLGELATSGASVTFEYIGKSPAAAQSSLFSRNTSIRFDPSFGQQIQTNIGLMVEQPRFILAHELHHAWMNSLNCWFGCSRSLVLPGSIPNGVSPREVHAVRYTNLIRAQSNAGYYRTSYNGINIP